MMNAEKLASKAESLKRSIKLAKEDREREMKSLKANVELDGMSMDVVIANANRIKDLDVKIEHIEEKLSMVEGILAE